MPIGPTQRGHWSNVRYLFDLRQVRLVVRPGVREERPPKFRRISETESERLRGLFVRLCAAWSEDHDSSAASGYLGGKDRAS